MGEKEINEYIEKIREYGNDTVKKFMKNYKMTTIKLLNRKKGSI